MTGIKVEGQTIQHTYQLDAEVVGEPLLGSLQCDFSLCEADFLRLTQAGSRWHEASIATFLIALGYAISIAAKKIHAKVNGVSSVIESWEYWALFIGLCIAVALFGISKLVPNEKKRVVKAMKEHFRNNPRERRLMRRTHEQ